MYPSPPVLSFCLFVAAMTCLGAWPALEGRGYLLGLGVAPAFCLLVVCCAAAFARYQEDWVATVGAGAILAFVWFSGMTLPWPALVAAALPFAIEEAENA